MKHKQHTEDSSNYLEIIVYNKAKETENRIASGKARKEELINKYRRLYWSKKYMGRNIFINYI